MAPGYNQRLFLLPFDHRASFLRDILHEAGQASEVEVAQVKTLKQLVYQGFTGAVAGGIPQSEAGILVDETYGADILQVAKSAGYLTALPVEKSGQDEFQLEYGDDFAAHIERFAPTFVKALVRYNPEGDQERNARQRRSLQSLGQYTQTNNYRFLLEVLVPALPEQLAATNNNQTRYDVEVRPRLTVTMVQQFHDSGVWPDIWKIEGFDETSAYQAVTAATQSSAQEQVGLIILGRDAEPEQVKRWLNAGKRVPGVIGFAIGRTIFREPLELYVAGQLSSDQAAAEISRRFLDYYQEFNKE